LHWGKKPSFVGAGSTPAIPIGKPEPVSFVGKQDLRIGHQDKARKGLNAPESWRGRFIAEETHSISDISSTLKLGKLIASPVCTRQLPAAFFGRPEATADRKQDFASEGHSSKIHGAHFRPRSPPTGKKVCSIA
jgi:hypothetical protein